MFFVGTSGGPGRGLLAALLLTGVILLGVFLTFGVSRLLSGTLLRGVPSSFTLELPPYRRPRIGQVVVRSVLDRTLFVLGRAAAVAAPAGLLIWLCANVQVGGDSILNWCTGFLDPFARLLGLDGVILMAFLLGFPANEIVIPIIIMAYLSTGSLLEFDSLDEEIEARKGRGCHLFIFSGGNPLAREQETIALCNKHTDCVFAAFTPPRVITGELCADLLRARNLFPAIQVDEDGADATRAAALLRRYKLPFGVACRCTAENAERVATELYYDRVIATGAKFCWFFTCPAYGPEQPASLEQLEAIHRRVQEFRRSKPLLTLDFWDGPSPSAAAPQGGTA